MKKLLIGLISGAFLSLTFFGSAFAYMPQMPSFAPKVSFVNMQQQGNDWSHPSQPVTPIVAPESQHTDINQNNVSGSMPFSVLDCSHMPANTVACYPTGSHAIVGESQLHYGFDVVWKDGNNFCGQQNFTQVFVGQGENGHEWEMSQWHDNGQSTVCPPNQILVQNAKESDWGDYFPAQTNYCVSNEEHQLF